MSGFESSRNQEQPVLGRLLSGESVFDRKGSQLHDNPELKQHLPLALEHIDPQGRAFFVETVDLGETIGESRCVETDPNDQIVFAQRVGRFGLSRFVINKDAVLTSKLTVILRKGDLGYEVVTAFIGPKAEREPWDKTADSTSTEFWRTHALIWGGEETVTGSTTDQEYLFFGHN